MKVTGSAFHENFVTEVGFIFLGVHGGYPPLPILEL